MTTMRMIMKTCIVVLSMLLVLSAAYGQRSVVLTGVTMIDGVTSTPNSDVTIVIVKGKIDGVGRGRQVMIPPAADTIDLSGKYIMPGLVDVRAKVRDYSDLTRYLAWGVTGVNCVLPTTDRALEFGRRLSADTLPEPSVYLTAPVFTAMDGYVGAEAGLDTALNRFPETPDEAREAIRKVKAKGIKNVEVIYDDMEWCRSPLPKYKRLKLEVALALLGEARKQGLVVIVQAPRTKDAKDLVEAGTQIFCPGFIDERVDAGTILSELEYHLFYTPSAAWYEYLLDGEGMIARVLSDERFKGSLPEALLRQYAGTAYISQFRARYPNTGYLRAQLPIFRANTMSSMGNVVLISLGTNMEDFPGIGAHLELESMVSSGLTTMQAIVAATNLGAQALNALEERGGIEIGKKADMIILNADPLSDIRNTRSIWKIVKDGKFYSPAELLRRFDPAK